MQLKTYQQQALDALDRFLTEAPARGPADAFAAEVARQDAEARAMVGDHPVPRGAYQPFEALPDVPYACLRIPTGGGKTLLAAEAVRVFAGVAARPQPLVLWFVPSNPIKQQTLDALKDRRHAYRQRLDAAFAQVRVVDVKASIWRDRETAGRVLSEDMLDDGAAEPPVAVREGMDGFEP